MNMRLKYFALALLMITLPGCLKKKPSEKKVTKAKKVKTNGVKKVASLYDDRFTADWEAFFNDDNDDCDAEILALLNDADTNSIQL